MHLHSAKRPTRRATALDIDRGAERPGAMHEDDISRHSCRCNRKPVASATGALPPRPQPAPWGFTRQTLFAGDCYVSAFNRG